MIRNRLPSLGNCIEIFIIICIVIWIVRDPQTAGGRVGGLIHGLVHACNQVIVFVQSI